jgi:hypothetical protein
VVAGDPSDAGALATAFSVLTPEESARVAGAIPGVEYLLIARGGRRIASAGWSRLGAAFAPAVAEPAPQAAAGQWDPDYELVVSLELARIEGTRARRPYVAVWIEDKDKFPVRTLTILYRDREARYLAELRQWYRADRLRAMADGTEILGSVSSATRAPGKYIFKWDMKDEQGKPVKPGAYTICIEAAREHGTYQLMRQPMDLTGADKQASLPINGVEVTAATLEYHKTAAK